MFTSSGSRKETEESGRTAARTGTHKAKNAALSNFSLAGSEVNYTISRMSQYAGRMLCDNQVPSEATYSGDMYFLQLLIAQ